MIQFRRNVLRNRRGVSIIAVLVAISLVGLLINTILSVVTISKKAQRGITENATSDRIARAIDLALRNQATCNCIFTADNTIAGATTDATSYSFDISNLPAGVTDGAGNNPAQISISSWDPTCANPGNLIATGSGGFPTALPTTTTMQTTDLTIQNLSQFGRNYFGELVFTTQQTNMANSLGSPTFTARIPVQFGVAPAGGNIVNITGCVNEESLAETAWTLDLSNTLPSIVRVRPLNDITNASAPFGGVPDAQIVLQFEDGVYRTMRVAYAPGDGNGCFIPGQEPQFYGFNSHGLENGGAMVDNNWYYLYAVSAAPGSPVVIQSNPCSTIPATGDANQFGLALSSQPPWRQFLNAAFQPFPKRYLGALRKSPAGPAEFYAFRMHGNLMSFPNPLPAGVTTALGTGNVANTDVLLSLPATANAAILNMIFQMDESWLFPAGENGNIFPIQQMLTSFGSAGNTTHLNALPLRALIDGQEVLFRPVYAINSGLRVPVQIDNDLNPKSVGYSVTGFPGTNPNPPNAVNVLQLTGFEDGHLSGP